MKAFAALFVIVLTAFPTYAEKRIWSCKTYHPGSQPILWLVAENNQGYVKFANSRVWASVREGTDAIEWSFGARKGFYQYGFSLDSGGVASYFDFTKSGDAPEATATDRFTCEQDQ